LVANQLSPCRVKPDGTKSTRRKPVVNLRNLKFDGSFRIEDGVSGTVAVPPNSGNISGCANWPEGPFLATLGYKFNELLNRNCEEPRTGCGMRSKRSIVDNEVRNEYSTSTYVQSAGRPMNYVLVILRFLMGFRDEDLPRCQLAPVRTHRGRYPRPNEWAASLAWVPVVGWLTLRTPTRSPRQTRRFRTRSPSGPLRGGTRVGHVMRT
jgi:hypothetical protein